MMTFLPANSAAGSTSAPPSGVACLIVTDGIFEPGLIMAKRYHRPRWRDGTCGRTATGRSGARRRRSPSRPRCSGRRAGRDEQLAAVMVEVRDQVEHARVEAGEGAPAGAVVDEDGVDRRAV